MEIKTVRIIGLGPIDDRSFEFQAPGLNVILGGNESGKSSFCAAVSAILYGFTSRQEAEQRNSWFGKGPYTGTVELQTEDGIYKVERNFDDDHVVVTRRGESPEDVIFDGDANPRGRTEAPGKYRELLLGELKLPPADVFRNSAFVGQLQIEIILNDELRRQISGAGQADYGKAREILRDQYYSLTREPLPGDRRRPKDQLIENAQSQLEGLKKQLDEAKEAEKAISDLTDSQNSLTTERDQKSEEIKRRQEEERALEQYLEKEASREKEQSRLQDRTRELQQHQNRIIALKADVKVIETERDEDRYAPFKDLDDEQLRNARDKLKRLKGIGESIGDLERQMGDRSARAPITPGRLFWLMPIGLAVIAAILGRFVIPQVWDNMSVNLELVAGVSGVFGGIVGVLILLMIHLRYSQWAAQAARLDEARRERDDIREQLGPVLGATGDKPHLDVLIDRCEVLQQKLSELPQKRAEVSILENTTDTLEKTTKEIEDELRRIRLDMAVTENKYPAFSAFQGERAQGLERLGEERQRIAVLDKDLIGLEKELREVEIELIKVQQVTRAAPPTIEEEITRMEDKLERYRAKRESLAQALQILDEAIEEYEETYIQWLSERTTTYFEELTDSRYTGVAISPGEDLRVHRDEVEPFSVDLLSAGAKDQLYLALRLAIVDLLSSGTKLPLILDDTFVNLDRDRLASAKNTVEKIAENRQVLLLSHSEVFEAWADQIIRLDD